LGFLAKTFSKEFSTRGIEKEIVVADLVLQRSRRFQHLARSIDGTWIGVEQQQEGLPKRKARYPVKMVLLTCADKKTIQGTYEIKSFRVTFKVAGELLDNRFLFLDYRTIDKSKLLLGTILLELSDDGELTGNAVGYSRFAGKITTASFVLRHRSRPRVRAAFTGKNGHDPVSPNGV